MRRFGILLAFLLVAAGVAAQESFGVPAFDSIAGNPVEYRRVLDKFKAGVERPSVSECTIAYYGFTMQEYYTPAIGGEEDMQRAIMAEDYATAYALGVRILEHAPVSLTTLYWTLFAATQTGEPWEVRNSLRGRYNGISHVISRSGDGRSPGTAFRVIYMGDMYTYTTMELDLEIGEGYVWDGRWTEFEVTPTPKYMNKSIFFEAWHVK